MFSLIFLLGLHWEAAFLNFEDVPNDPHPSLAILDEAYRLTFRRNELKGKGTLHVSWQGRKSRYPLAIGKSAIALRLAKGDGVLHVGFEDVRGRRIVLRNNSTTGDVQLLRDE